MVPAAATLRTWEAMTTRLEPQSSSQLKLKEREDRLMIIGRKPTGTTAGVRQPTDEMRTPGLKSSKKNVVLSRDTLCKSHGVCSAFRVL